MRYYFTWARTAIIKKKSTTIHAGEVVEKKELSYTVVNWYNHYGEYYEGSFHACVLSHFSHVWPFRNLWTLAHQAPLSMGFSKQEYWSGLPCLSPRDLPDQGIEATSPASPALEAGSLPTELSWKPMKGP